jgi:hypothetical protein
MRVIMLKKAMLAVAAVASLATATIAPTTASALPWRPGPVRVYRPGYWHGGWGPRPGVFAAGVLGVAIGASLAAPYYGPPPAYYAGPGYWGYWGGCRAYWRWSPYYGRYIRAAACY